MTSLSNTYIEQQFTNACCRNWDDTDAENSRKYKLASKLFHDNPTIDTFAEDSKALKHACEIGDFKVVELLLYHKLNVHILHMRDAFWFACKSSHIDIAEWILEEFPDVYHQNNILTHAFNSACEFENMDVAEWLVQIRLERSIDDLYNFLRIAHKNNKIDFAQWMLTVKPDLADYAFQKTFKHDLYDCVFKRAFNLFNYNLDEWLQTQNPFKYVIEKNPKKRGYIRSDCDAKLLSILYGITENARINEKDYNNVLTANIVLDIRSFL